MNFQLQDLNRVALVRQRFGEQIEKLVDRLIDAEAKGEQESGKLEIEGEIEDLKRAARNLQQGVFRLLVLGDMKRGKSTFLNALMGENLLPSDVNPCTAILTVLRYGTEKKVTVYFQDRPSETLDFETFKQQYTIDPDEAKSLEAQDQQAFPNVKYAVVEYPLPLLEKGIEIIDTPGLNDTEARNKLALGYLNNCHAVLFVFRAIQPCTLTERRYLENYIKDRGLNVFFLINAWDEIRKGLVDPDDAEELAEAESRLRKVFHSNLADYCQLNGSDRYDERVFEISSLETLRRRLQESADDLEGTGFRQFIDELNRFLTQERAIAQLQQIQSLVRQTDRRVREAIARRIPLLDRNVEQLQEQLNAIAPEFESLAEIRDRFRDEIRETRDRKVTQLAHSLRDYILNLGDSFETDFTRDRPEISWLDSLQQEKRDEFNAAFKQAFEKYFNEKLAAWERTAEQEMERAFTRLAQSAEEYGKSYNQILENMTEKLLGEKVSVASHAEVDSDSPGWAKWAMGFFSLASGNVAGVAMAAVGFDWKNILVNWLAVIGISSFLYIFTGAFFGPMGWAAIGLGVGAFQAEQMRQEFIRATRKEFVKCLPTLAQQQEQPIRDAIADCFDRYEREVMRRINEDIKSRKAELDNLVRQKESGEINREAEVERLKALESELVATKNKIDVACEALFFT
ncbi:MAG: dynamin family protein [Cyanobacteriota bacterium]|nr:dynamin family protein [Cyanobacteriota bacterium]